MKINENIQLIYSKKANYFISNMLIMYILCNLQF